MLGVFLAKEDRYTPHALLACGSQDLLFYDIRLPLTSVRKTVKEQPTPLRLSDYREPATQPACAEVTIEIQGHPQIFMHAKPSKTDFVTVQDVLRAVHAALHQHPPAQEWIKAGLKPVDVISTFEQRSKKLLALGLGQLEDSTYFPSYCDWLGSSFYFGGLSFKFFDSEGKNKKAQWIMHMSPAKSVP